MSKRNRWLIAAVFLMFIFGCATTPPPPVVVQAPPAPAPTPSIPSDPYASLPPDVAEAIKHNETPLMTVAAPKSSTTECCMWQSREPDLIAASIPTAPNKCGMRSPGHRKRNSRSTSFNDSSRGIQADAVCGFEPWSVRQDLNGTARG